MTPLPVTTFWKREKFLVPAGIRTPDHPVCYVVIIPTWLPRLPTYAEWSLNLSAVWVLRNRVISIVTRLWDGRSGIRILGRARNIFLPHGVPLLWCLPSLPINEYRDFFPEEKRPGRECTSTPLYAFMARAGTFYSFLVSHIILKINLWCWGANCTVICLECKVLHIYYKGSMK